jgi:glucuronate isomerase
MLGTDMEEGRIPSDLKWTGEIVKDICYRNAVRYFGFKL